MGLIDNSLDINIITLSVGKCNFYLYKHFLNYISPKIYNYGPNQSRFNNISGFATFVNAETSGRKFVNAFIDDKPALMVATTENGLFDVWSIDRWSHISETHPLRSAWFINDTYYMIFDDYIWSFTGYSPYNRIFNEMVEKGGTEFHKFTRVGENQYVIGASDGAYYLNENKLLTILNTENKSVRDINVTDDGVYYSIGNKLYRCDTFKKIAVDERNLVIELSDN